MQYNSRTWTNCLWRRYFVKDAAKLWNISERRVSALCKNGKSWLIPADAKKPEDGRVKTGVYIKNTLPKNLPLPIGISDYRLASTEYYYIDKTMMMLAAGVKTIYKYGVAFSGKKVEISVGEL